MIEKIFILCLSVCLCVPVPTGKIKFDFLVSPSSTFIIWVFMNKQLNPSSFLGLF